MTGVSSISRSPSSFSARGSAMRFDNSARLILLRTTFVLNDVQIRLAPELLEYARYLESADSLQYTQKSVVCLPLSI